MSQALLERTDAVSPRADVEETIPGVGPMEAREVRLQRRLTVLVTIVPFVGFAVAIATLWGRAVTALDMILLVSFYAFTGLGVTIGFHRLFTHRSFKTSAPVRGFLAIAGSLAVEGPVLKWVADHRRHHAYADQPGDPHSPHLDEGPGIKGVLKGLWHAHMGWFFVNEKTSIKRWAPDLLKDPMLRRIDTLFPLWVSLSFIAPALIGLVVTGSLVGAAGAFLWGSLVRMFLLHHVTWSVNSICHFYGKRPFETTDQSTNNWPLAIVSFGESWHNNHHAFPTSATHGLSRGQIDITSAIIRGLEKTGLAWDVKRVTEKQIPSERRAAVTS